jgi:trk system potassium uptake protein
VPEEFVGATLVEADLTNKYKVLVLTTIQSVTKLESQKEISFKTVTGIAK